MKLLLVDDDAFLRDMYATKFSEAGHTALTAKSGAEALRMLTEESSIDAVVMDMVMPGMDGVALLKEIAKLDLENKPKCIVLSNQGEQSDIDAAHAAGAVGYIIKAEAIPSEVVAKVKQILQI